MATLRNPISSQKISRIAELAVSGKSKSVRTRYSNELNRIYKQYQRIANQRLASLRKAGYDYGQAYESANEYIMDYGTPSDRYFHKPPTLQGLESQLLELSAFLRDPSSLVSYQRRHEAQAESALNVIKDVIAKREKSDVYEQARGSASWRTAKDFLRFMGSSDIKQLLSVALSTDDMVEQLYTLWESDKEHLANLIDEFSAYQSDPTEGLTSTQTLEWINSRYNDITKRRRR